MYDMKALYEAESVSHAIELLTAHPEAKIIAGGSDVLIQMREGRLAGCELVSIYGLDELRGISMDEDGTIRILPLTSFSHITRHPIIQEHINVLGEAVDMVGGPQIRNIGTIGGNTCNGVTSADSASTLHAYDAIMEITGPNGVRQLPIKEFYIKAGKVALEHNELLTAILIRKESYEGYKGHYIKYAMRNAMDIATTGCSVNVKLSADKKTIEHARIAYGVAAPVPMRAMSPEAAATGKPVSMETVQAFGEAALQDVNPRTSWRATKEFRLHLAKELAMKALIEAIKLSGGEL
ncbi:MAG: xanthine dehydrogenase FAD-binding subunit XdhB [Clostridia bacterium]|nr:xanthine dehydrogenase FAD-binding subunit XdhB [Clostridia bacterium]